MLPRVVLCSDSTFLCWKNFERSFDEATGDSQIFGFHFFQKTISSHLLPMEASFSICHFVIGYSQFSSTSLKTDTFLSLHQKTSVCKQRRSALSLRHNHTPSFCALLWLSQQCNLTSVTTVSEPRRNRTVETNRRAQTLYNWLWKSTLDKVWCVCARACETTEHWLSYLPAQIPFSHLNTCFLEIPGNCRYFTWTLQLRKKIQIPFYDEVALMNSRSFRNISIRFKIESLVIPYGEWILISAHLWKNGWLCFTKIVKIVRNTLNLYWRKYKWKCFTRNVTPNDAYILEF